MLRSFMGVESKREDQRKKKERKRNMREGERERLEVEISEEEAVVLLSWVVVEGVLFNSFNG